MLLGAVEGDVQVLLMDGASQLRVEGTAGICIIVLQCGLSTYVCTGTKITGKQLGAVNDIKIVDGECAGPPRCSVVAMSNAFWPAWNDIELVG